MGRTKILSFTTLLRTKENVSKRKTLWLGRFSIVRSVLSTLIETFMPARVPKISVNMVG
jgi:hypothetical protein